jgi:hypothetical protein
VWMVLLLRRTPYAYLTRIFAYFKAGLVGPDDLLPVFNGLTFVFLGELQSPLSMNIGQKWLFRCNAAVNTLAAKSFSDGGSGEFNGQHVA